MFRGSTKVGLGSAALALILVACGQKSLRRLMLDLNRAYLSVHTHAETEDFPGLQSDGRRVRGLVKEMRPYNAAPSFQASLEDLDAIAARIERAAGESDAQAARDAFAAMTNTCTACHRHYR